VSPLDIERAQQETCCTLRAHAGSSWVGSGAWVPHVVDPMHPVSAYTGHGACTASNTTLFAPYSSAVSTSEGSPCLAGCLSLGTPQLSLMLPCRARSAADRHHKDVVVAGLNADYKRKPFGQIMQLVNDASSFNVLPAKCHSCGG